MRGHELGGIVHRRPGKNMPQKKPPGAMSGGLRISFAAKRELLLHRRGFVRVFLLEAFDAPGRVNQLLFAGEEWVAIRADFHANHIAAEGRARIEQIAAGAVHLHGMIIGMNSFFHGRLLVAGRSARFWSSAHSRVARPARNFNYTIILRAVQFDRGKAAVRPSDIIFSISSGSRGRRAALPASHCPFPR